MTDKREEELERQATTSQLQRTGFLVTGFIVAFMVTALYLMTAWNLLSESLHFPQLSYWSATGLLGLVVFIAAIPTGIYLTCVKELD